jgi:hypothetical protein
MAQVAQQMQNSAEEVQEEGDEDMQVSSDVSFRLLCRESSQHFSYVDSRRKCTEEYQKFPPTKTIIIILCFCSCYVHLRRADLSTIQSHHISHTLIVYLF